MGHDQWAKSLDMPAEKQRTTCVHLMVHIPAMTISSPYWYCKKHNRQPLGKHEKFIGKQADGSIGLIFSTDIVSPCITYGITGQCPLESRISIAPPEHSDHTDLTAKVE